MFSYNSELLEEGPHNRLNFEFPVYQGRDLYGSD